MKYIDKVIAKMFADSIAMIKNNTVKAEPYREYYEKTEEEYIYQKTISEEKYFLVRGTESGIGLYTKEDTLLYIFESIAFSEFDKDIRILSETKKELRKKLYLSIMNEIFRVALETANSKDFHLKEDNKVSNCITF